MNRTREHIEGYRHGSKDAVQWLMDWARIDARDPHAKQIVYMLAFNLGVHLKDKAGMDKRKMKLQPNPNVIQP